MDVQALLLDTSDVIGIVVDAETYELLYLNQAALRAYDLPDEEAYRGKRCYEVLQGCGGPCDNCPIHKMKLEKPFRWKQFNQRTGTWHDNTDRLTQQEGRTLYIKTARYITARKLGKEQPVDGLSAEDTLIRCLRILSKEKNFRVAVRRFLQEIACYYQADRAYIFEFEQERPVMNNTFEWCQEGVTAEIDNLQAVPLEVVGEWIRRFEGEGEFSISRLDRDVARDTEAYRILSEQNIISLMAAPLIQGGSTVVGFLGVDNARRQRGDLQLLRSSVDFIQAELERRQLLNEMEYLSYTDVLTGAYNRKQYECYIKKYAAQEKESLGVVVVNINRLKDINTRYGTSQGDMVICDVGKRIRDGLGGQLFRVNGDEFVALCEGISEDEFQARVSDLRRSFQTQQQYSVSLGCAWRPEETLPEHLVKQAEDLMYAEKRNYYGMVLKEGDRSMQKGGVEEVLREIEERRFAAYFQPQFDVSNGKIVGVEALARKVGEDGKPIVPDKFIPFYEAAGVIRYVDLHMLELACSALREWEKEGLKLRVSVNFSRLTLMEPDIVQEIAAICRKYEVAPEKITVEVTENINKMEKDHLQQLTDQLREKQFHISLDDFGSSYSNLAILSAIDFDEVKFDRTLIHDIETNQKSRVVLRNSMKMCEELGVTVSVIEGIETKEQMEILRKYGCPVGQGYYFSKPLSQTSCLSLLRERRTMA